MDFSNLNILVTGASKGIGKCLCEILYKYGANVICVYNKTKINNNNYDVYKCDISNENEVERLYNKLKNKYLKIDVLVNCAAYSQDNDIFDKTGKEFLNVLNVNVVGTFLMVKYISNLMDNGCIINLSSTDASTTYSPISLDYCASKAAIENITKNLALRFPNLKICALAPNWVATDSVLEMDREYLVNELKRIGQDKLLTKEEVAIKIIEMFINSDYVSGSIIKMGDINE